MAGKIKKLIVFILTAAVVSGCFTLSIVAEPEEQEYLTEEAATDDEGSDSDEDGQDHVTEESNEDSATEGSSQQEGASSEEGSGSDGSNILESFDEQENSQKRTELKEENSELNDQLKKNKNEIKAKEEYSKQLQEQIASLSKSIRDSNESIINLNNEIIQKQDKIDDMLAQIEDVLALLRERLRSVHMAGDTSSLEVLLGAKSFSDYIDKSEMMRSMSEYDQNLIDSIRGEMSLIAGEQRALKEKKLQVEQEKKLLEANKMKINQLSEENTKLIESLKKSQDKLKTDLKNNEDMQKKLEEELAKYNKEKAAQAKRERLRLQGLNPEIVVPQNGEEYVWPCPGFTYLTSTFDEWRGENNHGALDIAEGGIYGAKVVACYDGVVFSTNDTCEHDYGKFSSCGCGGGYGNYVMIDHGNGKISIYGHLSGVTATPGQTVKAGQLIGYVGSSGYSTGPHLHFEMRYNGVRYDPLTEY